MIKRGDFVKVRDDLVDDASYDDLYFNSSMGKYRGKTLVVENVFDDGKFSLEGAMGWFFNSSMVTIVTDFKSLSAKARLACDIYNVGKKNDVINIVVVNGRNYLSKDYLPMYGRLSAVEAEIIEEV